MKKKIKKLPIKLYRKPKLKKQTFQKTSFFFQKEEI